MAVQFLRTPRQDLISPPAKFHPGSAVFPSGNLSGDEEWFFNIKIHKAHDRNFPQWPRKPKELKPMTNASGSKQSSRVSHGHSRASRELAVKPQFHSRNRKLETVCLPTPTELRARIDNLTARSIGDSLIFHNIPEICEGSPETEVVKFCHYYLVGRRIKHVHFAQVHKMEPRFSKDAPIAARFRFNHPRSACPGPLAKGDRYQPLPYIPTPTKKTRPHLKTKSRRKARYNAEGSV